MSRPFTVVLATTVRPVSEVTSVTAWWCQEETFSSLSAPTMSYIQESVSMMPTTWRA